MSWVFHEHFSEVDMRWKRVAGVSWVCAAVIGATLSAPSAVATSDDAAARVDHRRCVTYGEYRALHDGLTLRRVKRILDAPGKIVSMGAGTQTRRWFVCGGGRQTKVWVDFYHGPRRWREFAKRTNAS
jgi:hypothetical protein